MKKQIALQLGTASGVVIVGGVIVSALLSQTAMTYGEGRVHNTTGVNTRANVPGVAWIFGLVYIIPGIIGLVAAFVQNKCMYVTTCIFATISLLIMGLIVIAAGLALLYLVFGHGNISEHCIEADDNCKCRFDQKSRTDEYEPTPFKTCAYFEKFNALITALLAFVVLTWAAEITEFVLACYYSCRSKATAGVVIMPSQQPMLQLGHDTMPLAYGQPGHDTMPLAYGQPGHDTMPQAYGQPGHDTMPHVYGQPGHDTMPLTYGQPGHDTMPQGYGQGYPLPGKV